ncbi:tRNA pseudouridine synthase A isoform X2 [Ischnura elegans]|nr:tRNA pseudouridine synthase A isoform X2 [Ischnura elegans]XP_046386903.1 tRNA pseudouridine synthase A isoform X2 [Ischnura elegans]
MKTESAGETEAPSPDVMDVSEGSRKRQLSVDSSAQEAAEEPKNPKLEKVKRKKMAVLLAYSGSGYLGMQRNPGMKTIEEELLGAMKTANLISDEAYEHPQEVQFQRAARTDKGVSAARQIVSLKLPCEGPVVESINKLLPSQIRVMGMKRVTKGFNSKSACDARTYSYMLPTFALDPSVLPHASSEDSQQSKLQPSPPPPGLIEDFRLSPEALDRVNEVLKLFQGTHNFHNFTSRKKPLDPSAQRYIISMKCGEPEMYENIEFSTIIVKGQSFMLHQIRKMVGLAIAVLRGLTPATTIAKAWKTDRIDIPVAPSLGLVLEEVHYDKYNRKFGNDGMHDALDWSEYDEEISVFKKEYISSMIVKVEKEENSMYNWLQTLPFHSYGVREQHINQGSDDDSVDRESTRLEVEQGSSSEVKESDEVLNDESSSSSGNPSSSESFSHGLRTLANAAEAVSGRSEVCDVKKDVPNGQ